MTGGQSPPDPVEGKHHTPHHFVTNADFSAFSAYRAWAGIEVIRPSLGEAKPPTLIASPATEGAVGRPSMEWPTLSKIVVVGHYIFDSGTKICFPPMVFALTIEGVFSYFRIKLMIEYERDVTVVGGDIRFPARLKVIRLPGSWYGVVWSDDLNYASFSQDATELHGGIADMSDKQFLVRLQLVAAWKGGVNFEYAPEPSTSDDDEHSLDEPQTVDHQIRDIVDLDMRHIAIASELYMTMCDDDPALARTWVELYADERSEWTAEYVLRRITMLSRAFKALRSHPRYGYVATWLRGWGDEACTLKQRIALQLGGDWAKVEGLLNAELDRRRVG